MTAVTTPPLADVLTDALSGVASALEVPVHVLAIVLLILLAVELGRGATELWRRRRPGRRPLLAVARDAVQDPRRGDALAGEAPTAAAGLAVSRIAQAVGTGRPAESEQALVDYELEVHRRLDRTRLLVRAGPALGLMGTLIPLAPGLESLGRGDVAALAADMRTAFAATVVGLLVGTVAFALTLVRTRVSMEDLAALERATAGIRAAAPDGAPATTAVTVPGPAAVAAPAPTEPEAERP